MTKKEKTLDISLLLGAAAAIMLSFGAYTAKAFGGLEHSTFRLHILANSDSAYDQGVKYALRDYMLTALDAIFENCGDSAAAKAAAESSLSEIELAANEYLAEKGIDYKAVCEVTRDRFPTRVYEDFTLPAGEYDALRIILGDGEGKNWWCVLYPDVCLQAASVGKSGVRGLYEERKAANRMTANSLKAERGEVEYKFAVYEFIRNLFFP